MTSPSAHTQLPLYMETSQSFPTSARSSLPSIYVAFKVLQLVNTFRRRVRQTRAYAQDFCPEFERQAFAAIDEYLGRKTHHPHRKVHNGNPVSVKQERTEPDVKVGTTLPSHSAQSLLHANRLLYKVSELVTGDNLRLRAVARHIFDRRIEFRLELLSLKELIRLLTKTEDLLDLLATFRQSSPRSGISTRCEDNQELDLFLDETYNADLEHLLLCLRDQILRQLIAHCVELVHRHVLDCQRDQGKHSEDWFFEFPDSQRPLSTTWPWSIRPSLAVIWGVCWMFVDTFDFDSQGNMVDLQGNILAPKEVVHQVLSSMQRDRQMMGYSPGDPRHGFASLRATASANPEGSASSATFAFAAHPAASSPSTSESFRPLRRAAGTRAIHRQAAPDQDIHAWNGQSTSNTYQGGAAPPSGSAYAGPHASASDDNWPNVAYNSVLPEASSPTGLQLRLDTGFQASALHSGADEYWQALHTQSSPPEQPGYTYAHDQVLPHTARNSLTPTIRVTTDHNPFYQTPQEAASFTNASAHLRPQYPHFQNMTTTLNQALQESMQQHVPVSPPHSPGNGQIAEQLSRKRSHSQMSNEGPPQIEHYSREHSIASAAAPDSASAQEEGYSPRGSRSFKRGDPPQNQNGKFFCNFAAECDGQTFDRKCEWSKHMDKHDRPYRCPHPDCAKLQGFTYSGGLLRHEREVHGKHGGPKSQLMCPFEDCKRHNGKGFTRKENLNEHIRRVHESKPAPSQAGSGAVMPGLEQLSENTPASRISDATPALDELAPNLSTLGKRRHSGTEDVEGIKQELKRLREDNEAKEERMRRMEAQEAHREMEMAKLRKELEELRQGQQAQD